MPEPQSEQEISNVRWNPKFDEKAYIAATALKKGEDAYKRNAFNQAECDKLPSNREIPDTREYRYVHTVVVVGYPYQIDRSKSIKDIVWSRYNHQSVPITFLLSCLKIILATD